MFNVGGGEVIVILLVALIILGPTKLPEVARQVGRATKTLRSISNGFQDEMRRAMDDPIEAMARERGENVVTSEQKAAPDTQVPGDRGDATAKPDAADSDDDDGADTDTADSNDKAEDETKDVPNVTASGTADPAVSTAAAAGMYDPFAGKVKDSNTTSADQAADGTNASTTPVADAEVQDADIQDDDLQDDELPERPLL